MKKILLIMLLLTALTSMLLAEDVKLQEISLDEFLTDYLTDFAIIKRIQLEGIGRDFAVAKDTVEIVAINEIAGQLKVSFFDDKGSEKWNKWFPNYYVANCMISDNGQTIVLHLGENMYVTNIIISREGQQYNEIRRKDKWLIPSPDGNYLYWRYGEIAGRISKTIQMYNRFGEEINFSGFHINSKAAIRFITNDQILICHTRDDTKNDQDSMYISVYNILGNSLEQIWEKRIKKNSDLFYEFDWKKSTICDEHIAIYASSTFSELYVFDFSGNIVFQTEKVYRSIRFISENTLIALAPNLNSNGIDIINITNRNVKSYVFSSKSENGDWNVFDDVLKKDDLIFLDIIRVPYSKDRYRTIIWNPDKEKSKMDNQYVQSSVENRNMSYLFKYDSNPEIIILEGEIK